MKDHHHPETSPTTTEEDLNDEKVATFIATVQALVLLAPHDAETQQADVLRLLSGLSKQEFKVAALLCTSATPKEIARELHISVRTVEFHTSNIYEKLHITQTRRVSLLLLCLKASGEN